jgi:hypothetical protein
MRAWPTKGTAGSVGRMVRMRLTLAALFTLAAGCGGLGTPDLATGVVEGKVLNHVAGKAYVYPLGRPDLKQVLGADGQFRISAPVSTRALVVYDGTGDGGYTSFGRAGLVDVELESAQVRHLDDEDAADMPLAGGVLAGTRAAGAVCNSPRFTVDGTDQQATAPSGAVPAVYLTPLPQGDFQVSAELPGFHRRSKDFTVVANASVQVDVDLDPDEADDDRGCLRTGCEAQLRCESDGWCRSDQANGACGGACDGANPCRAGLFCNTSQRCEAPGGCDAYALAFGGVCFTSTETTDCAPLSGGVCTGSPLLDDHHAGYCTAHCVDQAQCPTGWTCGSGSVCVRP